MSGRGLACSAGVQVRHASVSYGAVGSGLKRAGVAVCGPLGSDGEGSGKVRFGLARARNGRCGQPRARSCQPWCGEFCQGALGCGLVIPKSCACG